MAEDRLITRYDNGDAYDPDTGQFDNDLDYDNYIAFCCEVEAAFNAGGIQLPVELIAEKSNWRGQDGFAEASSIKGILDKCMSFDNDALTLMQDEQGFYFRTASHDVPTGFIIRVKPR